MLHAKSCPLAGFLLLPLEANQYGSRHETAFAKVPPFSVCCVNLNVPHLPLADRLKTQGSVLQPHPTVPLHRLNMEERELQEEVGLAAVKRAAWRYLTLHTSGSAARPLHSQGKVGTDSSLLPLFSDLVASTIIGHTARAATATVDSGPTDDVKTGEGVRGVRVG